MLNSDKALQSALPFIVVIAPALIGLFFGAPLIARELETGTFRLVWTQSVTRRRWLAVKLGLVGIVAMAIGGLLTWMVDWWASPLDAVNQNRFGIGELRLPRHCADRVCGVRLRARRDGRCRCCAERSRRWPSTLAGFVGGTPRGDVLGSPEPRLAGARVASPLSRFGSGLPLRE